MKVSVVVLTWNRVNLLKEALDAILEQTYKDFEVLVIDNESTDNTEGYVKSIPDERVKYYKNANGGNLSVNRNFGIAHASGDYVAFCDDDDIWLPDKLQTQINCIKQNSDCLFCATNTFFYDSETRGKKSATSLKDHVYTFNDFFIGNKAPFSSVLINKSLVSELGGFDEDPNIFTVEDYDMWLRVTKKTNLYYIGKPLVLYRVHKSNLSKDHLNAANKEMNLYKKWENDDSIPSDIKKIRLANIYFLYARGYIDENKKEQYIDAFRRSYKLTGNKLFLMLGYLAQLPKIIFRPIFSLLYNFYHMKRFIY